MRLELLTVWPTTWSITGYIPSARLGPAVLYQIAKQACSEVDTHGLMLAFATIPQKPKPIFSLPINGPDRSYCC